MLTQECGESFESTEATVARSVLDFFLNRRLIMLRRERAGGGCRWLMSWLTGWASCTDGVRRVGMRGGERRRRKMVAANLRLTRPDREKGSEASSGDRERVTGDRSWVLE